ncbi:MAG TPA: 6-carboxytetrahydropterin synthase [Salinivirgaceae bacterium]|nr:6-carboxytetrahydropterin synthase [Salinivirgaceae bacterium]
MIYVTRRERFSSAHRLFRQDWDDEKNLSIFGNCSHPNWHGHNYVLWVTIKGKVNPETGFVVNLKELSKIIHEQVISKVDHRNLNLDVDFLQGKIISTETLAVAIWNQLEASVRQIGAELHKIKIEETENNYIEYFGE